MKMKKAYESINAHEEMSEERKQLSDILDENMNTMLVSESAKHVAEMLEIFCKKENIDFRKSVKNIVLAVNQLLSMADAVGKSDDMKDDINQILNYICMVYDVNFNLIIEDKREHAELWKTEELM